LSPYWRYSSKRPTKLKKKSPLLLLLEEEEEEEDQVPRGRDQRVWVQGRDEVGGLAKALLSWLVQGRVLQRGQGGSGWRKRDLWQGVGMRR
jgi:hypothetical protein